MAISFQNVNVYVQNSGILAESASIEISNSLAPANSLGFNGVCDFPPSGPVKTTLSFSYTLNAASEPNYITSSGLRTYLGDCPSVVHCAGLTAYPSFLESYNVRVEPNQQAKATASYVCFAPLVGSLQNKLINLTYPGLTSSGIGHGWVTEINGDPILSLSYGFSQRWEPMYKIGSPSVVNVLNYGGQSTLSVTKDTFVQPTFSGIDASDFLNPPSIQVDSLNVFCGQEGNSINLDMTNAKITSSTLSTQTKDICRSTTTLVKYH